MSTIKSSAENLTLNADGANNDIKFQSNGSEVASIDQAGSLVLSGAVSSVGAGANASVFNRTSSDGTIVDLKKDGTTVGSIGVVNTNNPFISNDADNSGLQFGTNQILPHYDDLQRDNAVDLGSSSVRFKDLYLSGGLKVGGTAAANALDDYEQGSFTPTVNVGTISGVGSYTKIGDVVTVWFSATTFSNTSSTSYVTIGGLPFTGRSNMGNATCGSIMSRYTDNLANQVYVDGTDLTFYGNTTGNWDILRFNDLNSGQFAMYGSATYGV